MEREDSKLFKLVSNYEPAGDQVRAIKELLGNFEESKVRQTLLGVTGSGKTFTLANVIQKRQQPALIMAPNKTLAAQLYSEFREFFPENAVEYFVSYYDYYQPEAYVPARDLYIEKDSSINEQIEQLRLSATKSLLERKDVIVIATVSAIYGLGDFENYHKMILFLKIGAQSGRKEIIERLVSMQYKRNDYEFKRGTFRVRGDLIDVFPSEHSREAIRIELFDDVIDGLCKIDALSGKVIQKLSRFSIYPASHYVAPKEALASAIVSIKKELKDYSAKLNNSGKGVEAQRLQVRTLFDLEMLEEIGFCKGIENYSKHLSGLAVGSPPNTLFDYLPKNALLIVDESHVTIPQIGAMFKGDRARKENLVNFGFRLPSALENRPLKFEEFEMKSPKDVIYVSATPGDYEKTKSASIVEQVIRPTGIVDPKIFIYPAQNQIDHLMEQIRIVTKSGSRVLVTSLTKKMAEQITNFLNENGVKAKYLHSDVENVERVELLRDLRLGVFDVLVGINLLREGLDLPEVELVAILDADKEGFLRSERSLVQTIGRAARNPKGYVILYADRVTKSMQMAISETDRRRKIQLNYNEKNGIIPSVAKSSVKELIDGLYARDRIAKRGEKTQIKDSDVLVYKNIKEIEQAIKVLEKKMFEFAKDLRFEEAVKARDEIEQLRKMILEL